jgi:hypothetical protein
VGEPKQREDEHHRGADEGADCGDPGDYANGAEGVGVQQQAAQGLRLEHRLDRSCQFGVGRGGLCLGAELGVGQAAADPLEVDRNEVVGVGLSFIANQKPPD